MSTQIHQPPCRRRHCPKRARGGRFTAVLLTVAALGGCKDQAPPTPPIDPPSRPAEILEITASTLDSGLHFPGRVRATQRVELAFDISGRIVELAVTEGERVDAGALLARLDPAAFDTRLAAAQVELDQATADYERVRQLWEKSKAVARAELDQKRTAMEVARSGYAAARKEVDDTRLAAPFTGVVARRYVENFQTVQAKEPVVSLQDVEALEIVIHVPERVVRGEPRRVAGYALFEGMPERRLPVTLKSFSTEADPQTQTYEVVLELARPADVQLLPGMSVEVFPDSDQSGAGETAVRIPLKAVLAGPDGAPTVWVVDPDSARVSRRPITVGPVSGADLLVREGLKPGERIVTAGVHHLRDGMRVHPL
ncbi:efflux RND transporter periplasmic adaptor subunit [Thiohalocapsa marina]|uniref:efflux RND transporter periplasmic adaptor subunit n=1 Tax=Thiohalocapsa marina TaxID=424902 RepID=UPI001B8608C8|nr:efflux RND transporter periplasmic adaptor subunit [Thiohalocapsa marina]